MAGDALEARQRELQEQQVTVESVRDRNIATFTKMFLTLGARRARREQ
jgi:hypothetical protein